MIKDLRSQFHIGSIVIYLNKIGLSLYPLKSQFHIGSIVIVWEAEGFLPLEHVSIPYWFDCNVKGDKTYVAQTFMSQFHIGSIVIINREMRVWEAEGLSQFHIGSIVMAFRGPDSRKGREHVSIPYWFDCNSRPTVDDWYLRRSLNSILVRL